LAGHQGRRLDGIDQTPPARNLTSVGCGYLRTARSLMSEIGIPSELAERTLGHNIQDVEVVYVHLRKGARK
jgi:hypothetical protein